MNLLLQPPASWQDSIQKLMSAWQAGRFPQAVLLDGPAGIGKKKLAMDLAQFLACENETKRPCGECFSCKTINDPGASDHWLLPLAIESKDRTVPEKVNEATTECLQKIVKNPYRLGIIPPTAYIAVPQVRHLWERISLKASGTRVYLIVEADCMNDASANALLKTLEEVPPQTYFILTTAVRHNLLQTIQSRCMPLRLPPLSPAEIAQALQNEGFTAPSADLLGMSMGSVGKALQCEDFDLQAFIDRTVEFLQKVEKRQWSQLFRLLDTWFSKELDPVLFFLEVLGVVVDDLQRAKAGASVRLPSCLERGLSSYGAERCTRMLVVISQAARRLEDRKGTVPMVLQTMALQMGDA